MEVLVFASRTGDSDLGLVFRGMTLTMLAQMWRAEMWKIGPLGRVRTYRDCD
jgi:hypothetical protein